MNHQNWYCESRVITFLNISMTSIFEHQYLQICTFAAPDLKASQSINTKKEFWALNHQNWYCESGVIKVLRISKTSTFEPQYLQICTFAASDLKASQSIKVKQEFWALNHQNWYCESRVMTFYVLV